MTEIAARLTGPVRVVGAGLLGASVGLGLRARGVDVVLADASPQETSLRFIALSKMKCGISMKVIRSSFI